MTPEQEVADLRSLCLELWKGCADVAILPGLPPKSQKAWHEFDRALRARGIIPPVKL